MDLRRRTADPDRDRGYLLERHCRINYACDCPWARRNPYEDYRAAWFADPAQTEGYLGALRESLGDARSCALLFETAEGGPAAYLWVTYYGGTNGFLAAEIQDLYVEESFRRQGLAAELIAFACAEAVRQNATALRSGTGRANEASVRLHEKMGFSVYRLEFELTL
ncbi:MAG: GNAT family N-acetyltransferase [Oscillospiraceae bacterium]|jgi:GNAT superfamily N-acetyltransferase|nr:GNAT family N-acetyltransferase [Oscillospiraceae bacterium]